MIFEIRLRDQKIYTTHQMQTFNLPTLNLGSPWMNLLLLITTLRILEGKPWGN